MDVGRNEERVEVNEGDGRKEGERCSPAQLLPNTRSVCENIFEKSDLLSANARFQLQRP